ncbi:MAG: hypothetical protein Q4F05_14120, partial [bacterium]|nr:hypothetical protein [bacterium]
IKRERWHMYLKLIDQNFRTENYACDIYINDTLIETRTGEKDKEISYNLKKKENEVTVCYTSKVLSTRWGGLKLVLNWFLSVLTGANEENFLGKPYDAKLKIRCKDTDSLEITTNPIWKDKPFTVTGDVNELENEFYAKKGYKARWGFGIGLPMVFFITILCIFFGTFNIRAKYEIIKWLLTACFVVGDAAWCAHVVRVLTRFKKKEQ